MAEQCGCFDDGYEGIKYCSLHEATPLILEALQEVEWIWVEDYSQSQPMCSKCRRSKVNGHLDICSLAAAIKATTKG